MTNVLPVSRALAEFVADARFEQLDAKALRYSRYALLDQLGVSLAAARLGEGCLAFTELAAEQGGHPQSTLFANGEKTSAAQAAFANGALSHALDFEDAHDRALVHPNAATIPAALAVAEAQMAAGKPVSGRDLLMAIVVGCEVVCRLGLALRVALDDYGWYPPPILGTFGATAAAARLYGLNSEQLLNAFSLALLQNSCSAEIKYNPHSDIRAVQDAFPAQAGVLCAQLAAKNISGFAQPFEGKAGFFALFARGHYAPEVLLEGLGERFEIAQLSFKAWPSCRGTHAYIEAALNLMEKEGFTTEQIEQINTYGHRINRMLAEPLESKRRPQRAIDAKFSIPYCVAAALHNNSLGLEHFSPHARSSPNVLALAEKINFSCAPVARMKQSAMRGDQTTSPESDIAAAMTSGRTQIRLKDGREFTASVDRPYGSPERPMSEADLLKKFTQCAQLAPRPLADIAGLAQSILSLDSADDLQARLFNYLDGGANS